MSDLDVVTGAFAYTGKYITRRLLAQGRRVKTLTGHPHRVHPFGDGIAVAPLDFAEPGRLTESLRGATTLYNTYWVRFVHGSVSFDAAVENTRTLIQAARRADVRRIVHLSITNPSIDSPLPYFKGKAVLEQAVVHSGLSYAIIRPTVVFGDEDILINNIAWLLRQLPLFGIPGRGEYRVQPVYVDDLAEIAVNAGGQKESMIIDAVGPEIFTFEELIRLIAAKVGSAAKIIHISPTAALWVCRLVGHVVRDVVLTREELAGLMADLLVSQGPPTGRTRLSNWLRKHARTVGIRYSSELRRHYHRAMERSH